MGTLYIGNRLVTPFVNTGGVEPTIVTVQGNTFNDVLTHNTIFNASTLTSLGGTFPNNINVGFVCQFDFTSGSTPTTINLSNVIWTGDNANATSFVPRANCRYTIMFYYDGLNIRGFISGTSI